MVKETKHRTVIFYKNYFEDFFVKQRDKVKDKIIWTLGLIEELQRVPETYLKHMENADGLFEIRIQQGSDIFRIFCFFDRENWWFWRTDFKRRLKKHLNKK